MNQRFTLDRQSFEHFLAAASLFQSLQSAAVNKTIANSPPLLQYSLETLRAVDSGTLDLQSSLDRVAGLAVQIVGGESAVVWLFTSESLICRAAAGTNIDDGHIGTALRLRLQSAGAFETNPPSTLDLTRTLTKYSVALGSSIGIALLPGGKIAGALAVFSEPSRAFTERNYSNLRLLAGLGQYVLTKWLARQELASPISQQEPANPISLQTKIASSLGRSSRTTLISAPDPHSIPYGPIPDLYVPGLGTRAALDGPNDRSHIEIQSAAASGAHAGLAWHSSDVDRSDVNSPSDDSANTQRRQTSPGGANHNSPALQRWEEWKKQFKSRRDDWVAIKWGTPEFVRRLNVALEEAKNIFRKGRTVRIRWQVIGQAAPAVAILSVMALFIGFMMGGRQSLVVGALNPVAQAAVGPVIANPGTNSIQSAPILDERNSTPAPIPASHLQITDPETEATIADLSKYEVRSLRGIASNGDDQAALELGMLYELGHFVPQSCSKATQWVAIAAQSGNVAAQYNLGLRYKNGDGVPVNLDQSETWLRKAASQKNADAARVLAELPRPFPQPSVSKVTQPQP